VAVTPAAAVGTTPRNCAQPNGRVTAVAVSGTTAYIAGSFTAVKNINGVSSARARLAAISTTTCDLLPWAPAANATVHSLAVYSDRVFVGGDFTTINGVARNRLALVSTGGALQAFNGNLNGSVRALAIGNGHLYAGGYFNRAGTAVRNGLAGYWFGSLALDATWKPGAESKVEALAVATSRVYVGGRFKVVNSVPSAANLAAVNTTNGSTLSTFFPRPGWPVSTILLNGSSVYAGGEGQGGRLGMWSSGGALLRPQYILDGGVKTLAIDGTSLFAGGHFTSYCQGGTGAGTPFRCSSPLERRKAFEVNLSTGALTSWAPRFDSPLGVFAMRVDSTHQLWVGGDFTRVGDRSASSLAVLR
jgi:hypothetical protein